MLFFAHPYIIFCFLAFIVSLHCVSIFIFVSLSINTSTIFVNIYYMLVPNNVTLHCKSSGRNDLSHSMSSLGSKAAGSKLQ